MNKRSVAGSACLLLSIALAACSQAPASADTSQAASAAPPISRPSGSPDLTSGLDIPARQRFIFAGGQSKPFTAFVTNRGTVPVQIIADLDGAATPIVTVQPGQKASHRFEARQAALFENPSDQEARLIVEVWGQTEVGMKYRPMMTDTAGG